MTTRVYFKRNFPFEPTLPTQYYAGQIVDLDDALANQLVAQYFAEVYQVDKDYPQPYEMVVSNNELKVIMPNGIDYKLSDGTIPDRTTYKSWRNMMGNGGFPRSKSGNASQGLAKCVIPVYDDIPAGASVVFGFFSRGTASELQDLGGAIWQVGLEYAGEASTFSPAYAIPEAQNVLATTLPNALPVTTQVTKTWTNSNADGQFLWTTSRAVKAGSYLVMHIWAKNGFFGKTSNDIAGKKHIPFSAYIGEGFVFDINSTNFNNNTLALFTDGAITGMSEATRGALTNTMINAQGGANPVLGTEYLHICPDYMLVYTDKTSIAGIGNSRNQKGGSSNATTFDQSYTFGYTGALLGRKFPILDLSAASQKFYDWVEFPNFVTVRSRALQYVTHIHHCCWENDLTAGDGTPEGLTLRYNQYMNLPIFQGFGHIASDIPPVNVGTAANPPSDYAITEATLFGSTANRNVLNALINSDARFLKVYQVNNLLASRTNRDKFKHPLNARAVIGSGALRGSFTVTNAVWDSTNGGQVTYTVSADPRSAVFPNKYVVITGATPTVFNDTLLVRSVTATTIVAERFASTSIGTYTSGGTLTTNDYLITLSRGEFKQSDEQLNIVSNNLNGAGAWRYRLINEVISPTQALIERPTNITTIADGEIFYIGGAYLTNWEGSFPTSFDRVHQSRSHMRYIDKFLGERGLFDQERMVNLPDLNHI